MAVYSTTVSDIQGTTFTIDPTGTYFTTDTAAKKFIDSYITM